MTATVLIDEALMERAKKNYELKEIERLGLSPELEQREQILNFFALLFAHNEDAGLIPPKEEDSIFVRHFCDSIQPLLLFGFKKGGTILDIGAGGGFPSIPICIFRPDCSFTLVESNRKKASFLKVVKKELGLENVTIHPGRIQTMTAPEKGFDYIMSRGVATMQKFSQMAKPFLARDGRMYTFKSKSFYQELEEITVNKDKDGVRISEIAEYDLSNQVFGLNLVSLELIDD